MLRKNRHQTGLHEDSAIHVSVDCSELENQEFVRVWKYLHSLWENQQEEPWTVEAVLVKALLDAVETERECRRLPEAWYQKIASPWEEDEADD